MRGLALILIVAVLVVPAARASGLAVVNGEIHTQTAAGVISHGTILIEEQRIVAVGANVVIPAGTRIVDAGGRNVTPGFFNSFTTLGLEEVISAAEDTVDSGSARSSAGPSFDVAFALNANSPAVGVARSTGLTRAISAPTSSATIFNGMGAAIALTDGPTLLDRRAIGLFVDLTASGRAAAGGTRSAAWSQLVGALHEAKRYDADRAGYLSNRHAPYALNQQQLDSLVPVLHASMPLVVSANRESDLRQLIDLQRMWRLRIIVVGGTEAWRLASELAAAHIPVILNPLDNLPTSFDDLGTVPDNALRLHRAGVTLAFGGSVGFGSGPYNVGRVGIFAGIAMANGLPRDAALAALTSAPARIWGLSDRYGTLASGMEADLIIWDGDPIEPSAAPLMMWVRGHEVSLASRQTLLRDRYRDIGVQVLPPAYRN